MRISLSWLFRVCRDGNYSSVGKTLVKIHIFDNTLFIFYHSSGRESKIEEIKSWILNIMRIKVKVDSKTYVHSGFNAIADSVMAYTKNMIVRHNKSRIVLCGYSQGGAVASIVQRKLDMGNVHCITFAQPKAYGLRTPKQKNLHRVYVRGDKVTYLPFFCYKHFGKSMAMGMLRLIPRIKYHYPEVYEKHLKGRCIDVR